MSCDRCGGTGKIHLLGRNYASCPDCEDGKDNWKKMVWEVQSCTLLLRENVVKQKQSLTFGKSSTEEFIIRNGRNNITWEANSESYGWAGGVVTDLSALVDWMENEPDATLLVEE